jgi:hypothetical protein
MAGVLDESKVPRARVNTACVVTLAGREVKRTVARIDKGINMLSTALSEKIEQGKIRAGRLPKRVRYAAEDGAEQTIRRIKRYPVSSLAIAFTAGATLAFLWARHARNR